MSDEKLKDEIISLKLDEIVPSVTNKAIVEITQKKPKPNNKTKSSSKKRPAETFQQKSSNENFEINKNKQKKHSSQTTNSKIPLTEKLSSENLKIQNKNLNHQNKTLPKHLNSLNMEKNLSQTKNNKTDKNISIINNEKQQVLPTLKSSNKISKKDSTQKLIESRPSNLSYSHLDQAHKVEQPQNCDSNNLEEQSTILTSKKEKTREEIVAEREAKKLAKQAIKNKNKTAVESVDRENQGTTQIQTLNLNQSNPEDKKEKTREEILAEREAKKVAKQLEKSKNEQKNVNFNNHTKDLAIEVENIKISDKVDPEKKPALTKAERRAIQEAQRAAKGKKSSGKQQTTQKNSQLENEKLAVSKNNNQKIVNVSAVKQSNSLSPDRAITTNEYKVKLFKHLDRRNLQEKNLFVNHPHLHPAIVRLGEQVASRTIVGSNARCIAFLNALKKVIQDYETPPKKEFNRGLESIIKISADYLHKCRPLAVCVSNAHKCIKMFLTQMSNDQPESELKQQLFEFIDTYIKDQIEKAALAISTSVQEKISNGDVILTFGCSSLINHILEEAHSRKIDFRVIVVDSRPYFEGQELLRRLVSKEIPCSYVLINAVGFIMPEVTKILMGAHALLANGYVMARTGTAQVALVARSFNVPVLVCCETHKFSERVQTDAIVYNELGNPDDLVINQTCKLANWQNSAYKLSPLNLNYDITPPELVTAVVTEVSILPCTSVPVILRLKPTEIGY